MPAVSVIIPTYNHARFVAQTLESVFGQTFADYEVIVVNDGSPDDVGERLWVYVESGRIEYVEQANQGPAAARNRGLLLAKGEFVAFLDDDDLWLPGKLQWQTGFLREHPNAAGVAGSAALIVDGERQPPPAERPFKLVSKDRLFRGNPLISPGQALLRTEVVRRLGGFDGTHWGTDDFDLWFRLIEQGEFWIDGPFSLFYRSHEGNASRGSTRMFLSAIRVIQKHLPGSSAREKVIRRRDAARWLAKYKWADVRQEIVSRADRSQWRSAMELLRETQAFWGWLALDPVCFLETVKGVGDSTENL